MTEPVQRAFFGKARDDDKVNGTHIAVYVVPVIENDLVAFDMSEKPVRGRWLPWTILPWHGNPWETAAELADTWCEVPVQDLALVDTLSFVLPGNVWELAIIFRAVLMEAPPAISGREVVRIAPDALEKIQSFEPAELARWTGVAPAPEAPQPGTPPADGTLAPLPEPEPVSELPAHMGETPDEAPAEEPAMPTSEPQPTEDASDAATTDDDTPPQPPSGGTLVF